MVDNTLMREINEDIRRDKARDFWKNNKTTLLAVAIAVVVGTGAGQVYHNMQNKRDAEMTAELLEAKQILESGKAKEAADLFEKAAATRKGDRKALLQVWQARAEVTAGDDKAASATLRDIIANGDRKSAWRDVACVWVAGLEGTLPKECASNEPSPLAQMKHELAAADALAAKDWTRARAEIASLRATPGISPEQQARAMQLELLLPPQETAKEEKK
jgi:hypothetical protein